MKVLGISAAIASASAYLVRRRISKKWIDYRSSHHDLTSKVILITGGNTGLGFEAAKEFARRNARVVIACRNIEKGNEAVESIHRATGNHNVDCMELDLASLASVRAFTRKIKSNPEYSSINALVCNAGVWVPEEKDGQKDPDKYKTKDGFEIHFGVNHLSHLLLAKSLTDVLQNSGDGRVVFVSSSLMKYGQVDFNKYDHIYEGRSKVQEGQNCDGENRKKSSSSYGPPPAYCDTKLMNALTCRRLSSILPPTVTTYAVCPGFCRSSLGRHVSFPFHKKILFAPIMLMIQRTSKQGAQNIIFATLEDKDKLKNGEFYKDGEIAVEQTDYVDSLGESVPRQLWEVSERLLDESDSRD
jgi:NAD(P)-dependent dehydrogenase (short-subunit alcohol dehydrogenase family)